MDYSWQIQHFTYTRVALVTVQPLLCYCCHHVYISLWNILLSLETVCTDIREI